MQEIDIKNSLDFKININGIPELSKMQEDELCLLATILELEISNIVQKKNDRKRYYNNAKQKIVDKNERPP